MNNSKPFSLIVEDFKKDIVNTINSSGLPLELVYYIIGDINKEIAQASAARLAEDKAAYEAANKKGT